MHARNLYTDMQNIKKVTISFPFLEKPRLLSQYGLLFPFQNECPIFSQFSGQKVYLENEKKFGNLKILIYVLILIILL